MEDKNYRDGYSRNYRNDDYERGIGLEKDSFQIIPEGMTEVVAVGLDQVQELVPIEIELDVISVESMIILQKTV